MALIDLLQSNPAFLVLVTGLLGLLIGSFLNVVIYRLPLMMEQAWRAQCDEILDAEAPEEPGRDVQSGSSAIPVPGVRPPDHRA